MALAFFVLAVLRRAWICDDALITMRAVDNLVAGRGFVFNVGERVLGFTNPLWALILAVPFAFVRDPLLVPLLAGVVLSGGFAAYLISARRNRWGAAIVLLALSFSRCFVDFSTSGLEGSLIHLILVAFVLTLLEPARRWPLRLSLLSSAMLVTRFDTFTLVLPGLLFAWSRERRARGTTWILLGTLPAIAWFVFSLVYYGFPLPNTAYAKLNAQIPRHEWVRQGLAYLLECVTADTMTVMLIAAALFALASRVKRDRTARVILVSMLLNICYVIFIGGDYMSGRFFTPVLVVGAAALVHHWNTLVAHPNHNRVAAAALAGIALGLPFSPFRDDPLRERQEIPAHGITNERAWYQDRLSLIANLRPVAWLNDQNRLAGKEIRDKKQRVVQSSNLGMYSWGAGPSVHIVDDLALTDPLLARIPFPYASDWRPGHLRRGVPEGYLQSIEENGNRLVDPCLARYYEHIRRVVRGPLFTRKRWASILYLNTAEGFRFRDCATTPSDTKT